MYTLIVNFNLKGLSPAAYQAHCEQVAPAFARIPGLISKVWLADEATNTYGGLYTWESRAAMEAYLASEIFQGIGKNPHLENVSARSFGTLEEPTRITNGMPHAVTA